MTVKRRGLGRGLDALLGGAKLGGAIKNKGTDPTAAKTSFDNTDVGNPRHENNSDLKNIPIEFIQRGKYQPRSDMQMEALEDLANSIKVQGVIQPIIVRPIGPDRFEIIAGERRWRATQMAGLDTIPAMIKPVPDEAAIAMALIENIQRENLNPIEEATALKRLQEEFELTQQEVADAVGKSRATVTNLMRLMSLNVNVRRLLEHGDLEMGHARALLSLSEQEQSDTAKAVVSKGLSVRQTESLVRRMQSIAHNSAKDKSGSQAIDPDIKNLEDSLSDKLGAIVLIQHTAKGKGRLILKYNSLDELDGILSHIN